MLSGEPSRRAPWRLASSVGSLLESRHLPVIAAALAVLLALPSLGVGWMIDDYCHRTVLLGKSRLCELLGSPSEMFRFFRGDPDRTGRIIDLGLFPWWTDPGLKAEMLQALTVLTHRLDYALWPDSPVLMHAQSLFWLGAAVAVTALFYRRILGPTWAAGVAALLFAVDDVRGATVGFLANRNVLVAATFGVSALIAHDRWRRDGSRPSAMLSPLLLLAALFSKEEGIGTCAYLAAYAMFVDPAGRLRGCLRLWPHVAAVVGWARAPGVLGLRRAGRGPLHRPADRHRSIPVGRGVAAADPPARPVEPRSRRRSPPCSGRRCSPACRGSPRPSCCCSCSRWPPCSAAIRSPASSPPACSSPRSPSRPPCRWTACSRSSGSARSACWPSSGRSSSAMGSRARRARIGASRR